jgi:hypothetical protein
MAGYRNISVSFWTDSKVDDDFTPEDKYFYLYLMTNPHTSICGCYEISMKQMERETGYNTDTVKRLLSRMEEMHNVIRYSATTKEVLILNWWKYNWSSSSKVKNAVVSVAEHIKHEPFKRYVIDRVSIRYGYGMDTTDTESVSDTVSDTVTETETVTENRGEDARQSLAAPAPSVEDVENYRQKIGSKVDAQLFTDFYQANGWRQSNGNPVKDWKAAFRAWDRREKAEKPKRKPEKDPFENDSFDAADFDRLVNRF